MRCHANSAKVQAISIPTGLDGDIGMSALISMASTCCVKQFEFLIIRFEGLPPLYYGEICSPLPMVLICALVDSSRIMEYRKETYDLEIRSGLFR